MFALIVAVALLTVAVLVLLVKTLPTMAAQRRAADVLSFAPVKGGRHARTPRIAAHRA